MNRLEPQHLEAPTPPSLLDSLVIPEASELTLNAQKLVTSLLAGKKYAQENILNSLQSEPSETLSQSEILSIARNDQETWYTYIARCANSIVTETEPTPLDGKIFTEFNYFYRGEKWGAGAQAISEILPKIDLKSCMKFVSSTFPERTPKQKWQLNSPLSPFQAYNNAINHFLFRFQSAFNQVARFHYSQIYKRDIPPSIYACMSQSPTLDPEKLSKEYSQNDIYPDATLLFQWLSTLLWELPQTQKTVSLLECVGTIAIWNRCYGLANWAVSSGWNERVNLKYTDVLILHTGLLALEKAVTHTKDLMRSAPQHRFDLLQILGYPKWEFKTLEVLKEPPISEMTAGFEFEDRRVLLEIIMRARPRFYDIGNIRNSLLSYLGLNPEKLSKTLDIVKNEFIGKVLTNAQIITLLEQNIPIGSMYNLKVIDGLVANFETLLMPSPKLVLIPKASIPLATPVVTPKNGSISPPKTLKEIQVARLSDLASKCGLTEDILDTKVSINPELIAKVFTLTKRGWLWRAGLLELVPILQRVWLSGSTSILEEYISKRSHSLKVSNINLSHAGDIAIKDALLSNSQEVISSMTKKTSAAIANIINCLDPSKLSSTTHGSSAVGSGGFAKLIRAILDTCEQQTTENNFIFLERSINFSWRNVDGAHLQRGVQHNKANLGIIQHLPNTIWLYAGLTALGNEASKIYIGGHGDGTTIWAAVKKALRDIHLRK